MGSKTALKKEEKNAIRENAGVLPLRGVSSITEENNSLSQMKKLVAPQCTVLEQEKGVQEEREAWGIISEDFDRKK